MCGGETTNPQFCSRRCSASRQLGLQRNPPKVRICKKCTAPFTMSGIHRSSMYCPNCTGTVHRRVDIVLLKRTRKGKRISARHDYKSLTIAEVTRGPYLEGKHRSQILIYVRSFNRSWNRNKLMLPCASCGYAKHVELAHIRPISSFPPETTLGEVNHPDNVMQLCPNCHWEFDNHLLTMENIWEGRPDSNRNLTRS